MAFHLVNSQAINKFEIYALEHYDEIDNSFIALSPASPSLLCDFEPVTYNCKKDPTEWPVLSDGIDLYFKAKDSFVEFFYKGIGDFSPAISKVLCAIADDGYGAMYEGCFIKAEWLPKSCLDELIADCIISQPL